MCSNMPNVYKGSGVILSIKYGFQTKEPDPNVVTFHFWPCDRLWVDQYAKYIRDGIQVLWNHTASCYDTPRSAINAGSFAVWHLDERWRRYHMKQYGFQCHFYCIEYSNMVVRSDKIKNNPLEWVAFYAKLYSIGCKNQSVFECASLKARLPGRLALLPLIEVHFLCTFTLPICAQKCIEDSSLPQLILFQLFITSLHTIRCDMRRTLLLTCIMSSF